MTTHIRWTPEERETVYRGVRSIANDKRMAYEHLSGNDAAMLMNEGQRFLPMDRRRNVAPKNANRDLAVLLSKFMTPEEIKKRTTVMMGKAREAEDDSFKIKPGIEVRAPSSPKPAPRVEAPKQPKAPVSEVVSQQEAAKQEKPEEQNSKLATLMLALIDEISDKVAKKVTQELTPLLNQTQGTQNHTPYVKETLPKVLVCGPMVKQQQQLMDSVKGLAELRFVSSDEGAAHVKARGKNCQAAIVWTSFISHPVFHTTKKVVSHTVSVSGGLSSLQEALEDLVLTLQ